MHQLARGIVVAFLILASAARGGAQPLVFLGDKDLRPYEFLDNGQPRGANVDLAMAVGRALGRPVEVRLMDWDDAQRRLLAGEAHALTMLGRTTDREQRYAFTPPAMPVAFALFVRADDNHRFLGQSLAGKTIGVTEGGLARPHLQATHPEARFVIVDTVLDGVQRLVRREIDAVAAQEWSAQHLLGELGISGVVGLSPFLRTNASMAVRKADAALAAELGTALQRIQDSGEFERILDRWSSTRVHLVSQRLATTLGLLAAMAGLLLLLLAATVLWQQRQRQRLAREVEHRRALEQDLRRSRNSLEEADRNKDLFIATLAHELRNPLAPILHATRVIELCAGGSPDVARARGVIERQTRHLSRLVDDLLDVGRISTGKLELRREASDLRPIVQEALESTAQAIAAGGHQVHCDVPPLWVDCDRLRIAQVLGNLLMNAAKHNPRPVQIQVHARQQDGKVAVVVRDDGVGIRPGALESVFELFHQERPAPAVRMDGLGIGLWLSRRLAELHGGTLTAHSDGEGRGSDFILQLHQAAGPQRQPVAPADAAAAGKRILVVDDNVHAAQTLAMMLGLGGHQVTVAHTGAQAIELASALQPHIVFLDIGLPDLNGLEVCRRLRRNATGAAMTIVAVTGWGAHEDVERSTQAGFDGHLTKPVSPEDIEKWLTPRQPQA